MLAKIWVVGNLRAVRFARAWWQFLPQDEFLALEGLDAGELGWKVDDREVLIR